MKITQITATPINLRLDAPYLWVFGELDGFLPTIVEVETEDGLTGLCEAPTPAAARIIAEQLALGLIGRDAFDFAGAEQICLPYWTGVHSNFIANGPCNKYHDPERPATYRRLPLN